METSVGLVHVFVILHMMGCFAFVLMVFSALAFPKVKRHPIWYNFCLAWVVFSLSYALLSFGGQQFSTPSRSLCITQAALVYAAPFLSGCASLALVGQLLFKILSALSYVTAPQTYTIYNVAAIGFPWIAWISTLLGIILHVRNDDSRVALSPNATFCVVLRSPIPRLTAVSSVVFSVAMLCLEGAIICMLYRNRAIKDILNQSNAMAFRVTIYTGAAVIATGAATAFAATNQRGAVFDVIVALIPVFTAAIFGSQMDLWEGYFFWKRNSSRNTGSVGASTIGTMSFTVFAQMSVTVVQGSTSPAPEPTTSNPAFVGSLTTMDYRIQEPLRN